MKIGFSSDNYIFDERDGIVSVCIEIQTSLDMIPPSALAVFSMYTIPITAQSNLYIIIPCTHCSKEIFYFYYSNKDSKCI